MLEIPLTPGLKPGVNENVFDKTAVSTAYHLCCAF
jgi:hypothetical protein